MDEKPPPPRSEEIDATMTDIQGSHVAALPTCAEQVTNGSAALSDISGPSPLPESDSKVQSQPKKKIGILHIQLLYHQTESGSTCRVCL